jgi:hypothetical protein
MRMNATKVTTLTRIRNEQEEKLQLIETEK